MPSSITNVPNREITTSNGHSHQRQPTFTPKKSGTGVQQPKKRKTKFKNPNRALLRGLSTKSELKVKKDEPTINPVFRFTAIKNLVSTIFREMKKEKKQEQKDLEKKWKAFTEENANLSKKHSEKLTSWSSSLKRVFAIASPMLVVGVSQSGLPQYIINLLPGGVVAVGNNGLVNTLSQNSHSAISSWHTNSDEGFRLKTESKKIELDQKSQKMQARINNEVEEDIKNIGASEQTMNQTYQSLLDDEKRKYN